MTNLSKYFFLVIIMKYFLGLSNSFATPNLHLAQPKPASGFVDFSACAIRRIVSNFDFQQKCLPTAKKIL